MYILIYFVHKERFLLGKWLNKFHDCNDRNGHNDCYDSYSRSGCNDRHHHSTVIITVVIMILMTETIAMLVMIVSRLLAAFAPLATDTRASASISTGAPSHVARAVST